MKILNLLFLFFCTIHAGLSQEINEKDIIGIYSQSNNNPEGGETLIIFPDNTYVLIYLGGFQKGKWHMENKTVQLEKETQPQFVLYGRKLHTLGNETRVDFNVDSDNGSLVSLNSKTINNLKPVFNDGANCFDYPYRIIQNNSLNHLHAAQALAQNIYDYDNNNKEISINLYAFKNLESFNDYILVNLPYEYTTSSVMRANYNKDILHFDYGLGEMRKSSLESIDPEELEYIKNFAKDNILPYTLEYGDELFPFVENPNSEDYIRFQRIEPFQVSIENLSIEKGSWFIAECDMD